MWGSLCVQLGGTTRAPPIRPPPEWTQLANPDDISIIYERTIGCRRSLAAAVGAVAASAGCGSEWPALESLLLVGTGMTLRPTSAIGVAGRWGLAREWDERNCLRIYVSPSFFVVWGERERELLGSDRFTILFRCYHHHPARLGH
jgi:hypothetical protein